MADYLAFIDESGDHGFKEGTSDCFALVAALYRASDYPIEVADLARIKLKWWQHEGIYFHAFRIRKKDGPFAIFNDAAKRDEFMQDVANHFARSSVKLIAAHIDKGAHAGQYIDPEDPYRLSIKFILERIEMTTSRPVHLIFESRGRVEDRQVANWCADICGGANYRGRVLPFTVSFAAKKRNVAGLQVADLAAPAIMAFASDPATKRKDWAAVRPRMRKRWDGHIWGWGLKCFP